MSDLFIPGIASPQTSDAVAWWFAFVGNQLLVWEQLDEVRPIQTPTLETIGLDPVKSQFLGTFKGQPCYSAELPKATVLPAGMALRSLRELYSSLDEAFFALAGLGFQIMEWDRTHQFCGVCGHLTESSLQERCKRCPNCGHTAYPRVAPAMIVLISRGDEILLGRAPRFKRGMYSLIAGYVEPGESLEEAVRREVKEEVGVEITDIRYWGSQPWPFPHTLMVGYTATYAGGDIVIDEQELAEAAWFHKDNLPLLPPPVSIARKMIDWFVSSQLAASKLTN